VVLTEKVERFQFNIDPQTPSKELLPVAAKWKAPSGPLTGDDLARVPELMLEAPPAKKLVGPEATKHIAHQVAKINHLNEKKTDGFLRELLRTRPDLSGLAFAMDDACRTRGERNKQFNLAVQTVRRALASDQAPEFGFTLAITEGPSQPVPDSPPPAAPMKESEKTVPTDRRTHFVGEIVTKDNSTDGFWKRYQSACLLEDKTSSRADRDNRELVTLARIAALMQLLAPESPEIRLGLVNYLAGTAHAEATKALARLAIYSAEEEISRAAVEALKVRRERDYTDILVKGLRYPYPAVARRTADAIAKLDRKDLLPQLLAQLEDPDPRAPAEARAGGKNAPVVRELVRVNHHRNCLLCHAPGNTGTVAPDTLTAGVPVPGEPLAPPSQGYQPSSPDIVVRLDVTYLRQDFSLLQPVADAGPWPEMQRFDFLVRTRTLTEEEANAYRTQLEPREEGRLSPYRRAALAALREMTGLEAAPTAAAWRRLLKLPLGF
jgi:hypothetical protein